MDEETRENVEEALSSLLPVGLVVSVKDGVVILEGAVQNDADKMDAERLVRQAPGVRKVVNNLVVETPVIAEESLEGIEGEEAIPGAEVAMEAVEDGEPYFPPTDPVVRPSSEHAEGLEIRGGWAPDSLQDAGNPHTHETPGHGDDEITDEVERALSLNALTAELEIAVETVEGVVYLRGTASSLDEIEEAESVAGTIPGVVEVVEEMEIQ